jgi:hypothetical protein
MSRATTLASVSQQLAISTGVAIGAFSVEATMLYHHSTELTAADSGHQVSGRRMVVISDPTRESEAEEETSRETATARDQRLS